MKTASKKQQKLHVKRDDRVMVIAGDDKGKEGRILRVFPKENRALVEGLNMVTKHNKPNAQNTGGGIVKKEAPIHISNLMVIDKSGKPSRIGREEKEGKLVRVSKKSKEEIA